MFKYVIKEGVSVMEKKKQIEKSQSHVKGILKMASIEEDPMSFIMGVSSCIIINALRIDGSLCQEAIIAVCNDIREHSLKQLSALGLDVHKEVGSC